ncbi:hypothetical protein HXP44_18600 [Streptomyces sioyaensis]|uniref:hypothetical protein n=2 Tax=Streptomyces sioyaensis TaxID=67364 RepID=UPI00193F3ADE|nr:hypothetical protein [Streptomyces sioyaensis]MBM4794023.1 hypothetical protein [Streptomyces sioyaensis]
METSYEERRPAEPDEELERGRRAAPANTAGAVSSKTVVTIERPWRGGWDTGGWLRGRTGGGEEGRRDGAWVGEGDGEWVGRGVGGGGTGRA